MSEELSIVSFDSNDGPVFNVNDKVYMNMESDSDVEVEYDEYKQFIKLEYPMKLQKLLLIILEQIIN